MKNRTLRFLSDYGLLLLVTAWLLSGAISALSAQDVALPASAIIPAAAPASELTVLLVSLLDALVHQFPWLSVVFMAMGLLRTCFKPLVSWLEARAAATPDTADDERLKKAEASWWFRALAWLLDFTASIKVGPQKR